MIPKDATTTELTRDVAIIGAGPSGLTAAYRLQQAGHTVAVIEARERVGGRTWSNHINGAFLEIGGQWVSPDQTALISLISELGLKTFSRYRDGENLYRDPNGTMHRYTGDMFPANEKTQQEMVRLIEKLDALAAEIGAQQPWAHPKARELDTISFHHWLRTQSDDEEACNNIGLFIAGLFVAGTSADLISFCGSRLIFCPITPKNCAETNNKVNAVMIFFI